MNRITPRPSANDIERQRLRLQAAPEPVRRTAGGIPRYKPLPNAEPNAFTRSELRLDYAAWTALAGARRPHLTEESRKWLAEWDAWDMACSPMDDAERRLIRYGHHLGWFDRRPA